MKINAEMFETSNKTMS